MRILLPVTLAGLAAACTMNDAPEAGAQQRGAEQLATALAGYEPAGPPTSCVQTRDLRGNRSAGDAIIFEGVTSSTLYVNRPAGGCPSLEFGRALLTRSTQTQLCRGDIATVFDPVSGADFGGCGLGDFQPYRRVRR